MCWSGIKTLCLVPDLGWRSPCQECWVGPSPSSQTDVQWKTWYSSSWLLCWGSPGCCYYCWGYYPGRPAGQPDYGTKGEVIRWRWRENQETNGGQGDRAKRWERAYPRMSLMSSWLAACPASLFRRMERGVVGGDVSHRIVALSSWADCITVE